MNPLLTQGLSGTIRTRVALNERVRQQLREAKARRGLSERDISGFLNWSQSKVAYKFSGRTPITLDELEALCFALGTTPTEVVRDRGLEFCAEMTPTELRILELIRRLPKPAFDGLLTFLNVPRRPSADSSVESRGATPKRSSIGKPRPR